jgi:hypothetical protein
MPLTRLEEGLALEAEGVTVRVGAEFILDPADLFSIRGADDSALRALLTGAVRVSLFALELRDPEKFPLPEEPTLLLSAGLT